MSKVGRNAPCPCGSGKKYKHCCFGKDVLLPAVPVADASSAPDSNLADPFDFNPRAMERAMADLHRLMAGRDFSSEAELDAFLAELPPGPLPHREPETPLERAQDLMFDAYEATGRRREQLARQALELSPDCADAYVFLGDEVARTPKEALGYYQQGIAAGERAIGREAFVELAGDFWGELDSRPYMRALFGRAQALSALDRHAEAAADGWEMLRLNPGDNQGVRYFLLGELFARRDDDGLAELLDRYPDEWSARWLYARALHKFRRYGDGLFPRRALTTSLDANPFVPPYLLGTKRLPRQPPSLLGFGDDSEAQRYVAEQATAWIDTPGALAWLRQRLAAAPDDAAAASAAPRTGPRYFLNDDEDYAFSRCPECDEGTKRRRYHLTVLIEPSTLLLINLQCRYCERDDLLIAKQDDLDAELAKELRGERPELIGNDYVAIGIVDRADLRELTGELDASWTIAHTKAWREVYEYDEFAGFEDIDEFDLDDDDWPLVAPVAERSVTAH